jgi:hypothetical protein
MARFAVRLICLLTLFAGSFTVAAGPALAAPAYSCPPFSEHYGIYTEGVIGGIRWGWVRTVHSPACYHWGSVALHDKLEERFQVNVTLERWRYNRIVDHRYCYIKPGGSGCYTEPVLTGDCSWTYVTNAKIYHWSNGKWSLIAWSSVRDRTASCMS